MIDPPLIRSHRSTSHPVLHRGSTTHQHKNRDEHNTVKIDSKQQASIFNDRHAVIDSPASRPGFARQRRNHRRRTPLFAFNKTTSLTALGTVYACLVLFAIISLLGNGVSALALPADGSDHHLGSSSDVAAVVLSSNIGRADNNDKTLGVDAPVERTSHPTLTPRNAQDVFLNSHNALMARAEPPAGANANETCSCDKGEHLPIGEKVGFGILMPMLVLLSGLFAGLTLGYMSLDETQLQVLAAQGTPQQRADAAKITSVTKDKHLLLTTLLIANMITNETLPVIADPLLGGGVQAVVVSTVLVIIFAELIPQSVCACYGLVVGAYMVWPTRIIIFCLYPIAWPVSRILHWLLGAHSGIVYRRAELKELVTMHAAENGKGGDLKGDTIMIVGGALDLQEKVVKDAMTPIDKVFMLPYSAKLDYPTLERIVRSGHSRIPIYQEFEVPVAARSGVATPTRKPSLLSAITRKATSGTSRNSSVTDLSTKHVATNSPRLGAADDADGKGGVTFELVKRKKILGTLLVKSCVLLDPEDATPVADMVINAIPTVPGDEPLLNVLNVFQEGRSHMAIVSSRSRRSLADGIADVGSKANMFASAQGAGPRDGLTDIDEEKQLETINFKDGGDTVAEEKTKEARDLEEAFSGPDGPIGVITLEDVLEELIGEEIWDEYDTVNGRPADFARLSPPPSPDSKGRDPHFPHSGPNGDSPNTKTSQLDGHLAEKAAAEDEPTVIHGEQAQHQEAAVGAAAPKTVLQRLGLGGRAKSVREDGSTERTSNISSVAAIDTSPVPSKTALPVGVVQTPPRSISGSKGTNTSADVGSASISPGHAGTGATTSGAPAQPVSASATNGAAGAGSSVRPVILRSTTASGQTSTATAVLPESLLRGRRAGANETEPLPPGSVVQLGPPKAAAGATSAVSGSSPSIGSGGSLFIGGSTLGAPLSGSDTRTFTPLGSSTPGGPGGGGGPAGGAAGRANRFKSTPVPRPTVRARSMGPGATTASASSGGTGLESSIASLSALVPGAGGAGSNSGGGEPGTIVASPPAIEPETAPLDASIASLASLGGGPKSQSQSGAGKDDSGKTSGE